MVTAKSSHDTQPLAIDRDDILQAARRVHGQASRTAVFRSRSFDAVAGVTTWFKCEQFQRTGSFKFRGAYNKLATLSPGERKQGVVAFSSGNHGQAVALSAKLFGAPAVICMPSDAPSIKIEATRGYGAEVVLYDRLVEDREALARRLAEERGLTLVPPFDDPAIMAGQGTAAREFLQETPELDVIVAPVGGGGLIAGTAVAAKAIRPDITIVGVEPTNGDDARQSLARGERVSIPPPETVADGVRTTRVGALTFEVMRRHVETVLTVSDEEIVACVRFLAFRRKLLVEPTGAVAAAAVLAGKLQPYGKRVGVILSGGNVGPDQLVTLLSATS